MSHLWNCQVKTSLDMNLINALDPDDNKKEGRLWSKAPFWIHKFTSMLSRPKSQFGFYKSSYNWGRATFVEAENSEEFSLYSSSRQCGVQDFKLMTLEL